MPRAKPRKRERPRGGIDQLPSGALRVRVDAGVDRVTKKPHYLTEVIPAGTPDAADQAEVARTRFLNEVDEKRNAKTKQTVNQLLDRYIQRHFQGAPSTRRMYVGYSKNHIRPILGDQKVGDVDADLLDSFYEELLRCRHHCDGKPHIQHRTKKEHTCDPRCRPHRCEPLGDTTIRHMH